MPAGRPLDLLILHFRCSAGADMLLDILRDVADVMQGGANRVEFRRTRQRVLPDRREPKQAKEEIWERPGARIEFKITPVAGPHLREEDYELTFRLFLDTSFSMEIVGRSPATELPELWIQLAHLWPNNFDDIQELLRDHLGAEADVTNSPRVAEHNARAALQAGHGAFARAVIDQAMSRRGAGAMEDEEKWWSKLRALSKEMGEG